MDSNYFGSDHYSRAEKIANLGSWKIELKRNIVVGTDSAIEIYGLSKKNFTLAEIQRIPLPEYRTMLDEKLKDLIMGVSIYDVEFQLRRQRDGEIRWVRSVAEYDETEGSVTGIIQDITESKLMKKALEDSEKRYRNLFDNSVSGILYMDLDGNVIEANRKMLQILGSPSLEETKKINVFTFKSLVDIGFSADFSKAVNTAEPVHNLIDYESKWGNRLYLEYHLIPIVDSGQVVGVMGKVDDITEKKQAEEKIEALLKEKDIILREVHHRIKNNMAAVESLLMIQDSNINNDEISGVLMDAAGRLSSMRILYEKLYQSEDFMATSSKAYFTKLIDEIAGVYPQSDTVTIEKNLQDFIIPTDIVFSLGIILNELLTNAMKYAFTDAMNENLIKICVQKDLNQVSITFRDNGIGFGDPEHIRDGSFGIQLIKMLTKQIGGSAEFYNEDGAVCLISFII
ncbi:MAG: PAS domain S-box protein [Spirochaetales bacterium]|uniref:histidine kinase n=1 Tax=Candidatus Thalassospirochaeta sargassi TaxID=3119039 RepID=A0AAJ1IGC3_9SPIO|nr:PAS domain S-box protein [Spirochaetales bacterium]